MLNDSKTHMVSKVPSLFDKIRNSISRIQRPKNKSIDDKNMSYNTLKTASGFLQNLFHRDNDTHDNSLGITKLQKALYDISIHENENNRVINKEQGNVDKNCDKIRNNIDIPEGTSRINNATHAASTITSTNKISPLDNDEGIHLEANHHLNCPSHFLP